jgi:PAS domain S-box-containing protein
MLMTKKSINVLILEDSETDAELIERELNSNGNKPMFKRAFTSEAMKLALMEQKWDIIISDFNMTKLNGFDALNILKESGLNTPVIFISDSINEETAVKLLRQGARDCLAKDNLPRLLPILQRELNDLSLRSENEKYKKAILENKESQKYKKALLDSLELNKTMLNSITNHIAGNDKFTYTEAGEQQNIFSQNYTEIKHLEDKQHENRFRNFFEHAPIGISIVNIDGRWIDVNKYFCDLVGYSREELLAKGFSLISNSQDNQESEAIRQILDEQLSIFETEKCYIHKEGNLIWVSLSSSLVRDEQGKSLYFIFQIQDITRRKKAEEELAVRTAELERSNADLEQFAYVASHDLQEPLRAITGYLDLLSQSYSDKFDEDGNYLVSRTLDASARMKKLISDLLVYSRAGRKLRLEQIDCNTVLDRVINNLQVLIEENNAAITYDKLPVVKADSVRMEQLFQNLIGNAIKYRNKESTPEIHISVTTDKHNWTFAVQDNGIGIAEEFNERIFKIFKRLHNREEYPGSGIGLAVCKKIVEQYNGNIWVKSQPDKGSIFYFTIPRE